VDVFIQDLNFLDLKSVLKHSRAHVTYEGGTTHIATQLGTKCVVTFGPTLAQFSGYPSNVNISSTTCSGCFESGMNWNSRCARGLDEPACMESITGMMVYEGVCEILHGNKA